MLDRINCRECLFFYVTWKPSHPLGCKKYGIESIDLPSVVVKSTSGESCKVFTKKNKTNFSNSKRNTKNSAIKPKKEIEKDKKLDSKKERLDIKL